VRSGQLIATVGDSAMIEVAQEPHLHFEMTVSDLSVDPLKYFDETILESIKADTTHE
jgi:murein DD-endopeptidase MepM/ murein hydrolase activator NlpD